MWPGIWFDAELKEEPVETGVTASFMHVDSSVVFPQGKLGVMWLRVVPLQQLAPLWL